MLMKRNESYVLEKYILIKAGTARLTMEVNELLDIIGIGKPIKDLLVAVDSMPKGDGATMARAVSSQGGGNCASAIIAAARLGMKCGIYSNIGDDAKGQFCRDDFLRHGVDVSHLRLEAQKTTSFCLCIAETSSQTRRFIGQSGTASELSPDSIDYDYIKSSRLVHFDGYGATAQAVAKFARSNGIITSIDAGGYSPGYVDMEPLIDLFIASEFYMAGRFPGETPENAVKKMAKAGCKVAVITLGASGLVGCVGDDIFSLPAFKGLEIVDTTGAGDVFHGAFASAYLMGMEPVLCAKFASAVSYIKCTRIGGRSGIPTRNMVEHFLKYGELIGTEELDARQEFYKNLVV